MGKKEKTPFISVCIPTFNRCETLGTSLSSIIYQEFDDCEIVVVDNASSDETEALMKKFKNVRYYRNATNEGFDRNVLHCFEKAKGKYVLFLSDTDILLEGSLKHIKEVLVRHNPSCAFLNNYEFNVFSGKKKLFKKASSDLLFSDNNEFFNFLGLHSGWISAIIIKRKDFDYKTVKTYDGWMWAQWCLFVKASEEGISLFISKPCSVGVEYGNKIRYNFETAMLTINDILEAYYEQGVLSRRKTKRLKREIFKNFVRSLFVNRINGRVFVRNISRAKKGYHKQVLFKSVVVLIHFLPSFLFKIIKWVVKMARIKEYNDNQNL